jgi:probable F420-dependent oxidoreductase
MLDALDGSRGVSFLKFNARMLNASHVKALRTPEWETRLAVADHVCYLRLVDELGYHKATCPEHFVISEGHRDLSGEQYFHATTALAFIAGVAPRIKVASQITILPLLNPIVQAKMWATLDCLSGGRAIMQAAVGWHEEEYGMLGVPFHERGRRMDEYIEAILELWRNDNPIYDGEFVKFKNVGARPKPVNGTIPIWFGGDAPAVLRRVAKWGSGWSPALTAPEEIPQKLDFIRQHPDYKGQPLGVVYSLVLRRVGEAHAILDAPESEGLTNAQALIDQIGWLESLGVTETSLPRPHHRDFEEFLDWVRWTAAEIMPHTG